MPRTIRKGFGEARAPSRGLTTPRPWLTTIIFTAWTKTSDPSSSSSVPTFPTRASSASTGTSISMGNWPGAASNSKRSTTGSCVVRTRRRRSASRRLSMKRRSERFFRKWLSVLPHPYPAADRKAGFRYRLSVLQAEFSLTQIWDRPRHGREFFEEVIRENIDLGRPETVQLIFARRMRRSTGRRPMQDARRNRGMIASLHVSTKHAPQAVSQDGRARCGPATQTTINNSYDFGVGRLLGNLPKLRAIGFAANRRMLEVEKASHDCRIGAHTFEALQSPATPSRASAPAHCVLATRACSASSPCSCCFASSSKASATGNCGHYLRRCSGWKKATSVRAA